MKVKELYEQKYRKLMLIPLLLFLLAVIQISYQYTTTGDFTTKGIGLKGGSTITIDYDPSNPSLNPIELQQSLQNSFPETQINIRTLSSAGSIVSLAIDSNIEDQQQLTLLAEATSQNTGIPRQQFSVEVVGSAVGQSFFRQVAIALLIAFLLMGLVVLVYFRTFIPSMAVISAALGDIIITLAIFNLTGMPLNAAGVAAFLMLIGYSVDSDILLTSRTLKRLELPVMERIYSSIKTGLTMTLTALAAVGISLIFIRSEIVQQIMLIIFIGLLVDIIMTYLFNVGLLRWYLEKRRT